MLRILVVDDSDSLRFLLKAFFKDVGVCDEAPDGARAVELVRESLGGVGYDVVFMDIMMPGMDGLEATRRIRDLLDEENVGYEARPRIVMLTCVSDSRYMLEAQYECGADAYVTKPFGRDLLFEVLANMGLVASPLDGEA
ncbi:response regulator [Desulfocurvus sp.]|uniref:response regulator n=1 Tax=Desulfocurvus sp. TaxID=2871698 RepID=UPI0025B88D29|nr:response regulator [Desulfocurvus sp.]MCK9241430.1 response regulator [Desulfocurvus sp.]